MKKLKNISEVKEIVEKIFKKNKNKNARNENETQKKENIRELKKKITENNFIIIKADKGNTAVVMNKKGYIENAEKFIQKAHIKK